MPLTMLDRASRTMDAPKKKGWKKAASKGEAKSKANETKRDQTGFKKRDFYKGK